MKKIMFRLVAGLVMVTLLVTPATALNVGYVVLGSPSNTSPEGAITDGGHNAFALGQITGADLSSLDMLWVLNPYASTSDFTNNLAMIDSFVSNGGSLMFHDRDNVINIIPGSETVSFERTSGYNVDIAAGAEDIAAAMGIDNTTLDGGNYSNHGYSLIGSLPAGAVPILTTGDPDQIIDFYYDHGAGVIYYSTVPLDCYLPGENCESLEVAPNFQFYAAVSVNEVGKLIIQPDANVGELHTSVPMVAFKMLEAFNGTAGGRMLHLRQSGHEAFALADPLDGLMLASAGDIQDIGPITGDGKQSKNVWGKLYGLTGNVDGDETIGGYDYSIGGFVMGADFKACKGTYLGLMAGFSGGKGDTDDSDNFDVKSYQVGLYSSYENGPYYLDGIVTYASSDYETNRETLMGTAEGDYDGDEWGASVELGYAMHDKNIVLEPYLGTQYIYVDQDGFDEKGADSMNMSVKSRDAYSLKGIAGGKISGVFAQDNGRIFIPSLKFAFKHEFGDDQDVVTTNFVNTPAASSFTFDGIDRKRNSIELGVGSKLLQENNVSMDIDLMTEFNGDEQLYAASVGLRYVW